MARRTQPPAADIAKLVKRIRKPGLGKYAKICVYGDNGTGKTRFAGTASKVLLVDINEEGDRSVKGIPGVRVLPIKTWQDIGNIYWYLKSGNHPFESVAIDTVTAMHELAMSFVLGEAETRDPTREKSMPVQRDWNRSGQLTMGMLLAFRNLPMHVIFLAQERVIRDDDTEEIIEITIDLPKRARATATACVGIIGRMSPERVKVKTRTGVKRQWQDRMVVGKSSVTKTKDRTFSLGDVVIEPTMDDIIKVW